ncbi:hypothetical protein POM88_011764 [Heracleum sosnowskyi]|uniref:Uncharacterized protein n=1 Tax=Heracleum sosnowskyi TaxID=360622 RepID=A0AAD8IWU6_9APIA|nr:hypothetical protein POM88_011764 [Heracleum sosnowskyi]
MSKLEPLTEQQMLGITNLQQSSQQASQQAEDALSQGMEALQQSLTDTLFDSLAQSNSLGNVASYMGQMAMATGKLGTLANFNCQVILYCIVPSNLITSFFPRADKQEGNSARNNESGCDVEQGYEAMGRFVCAVEVSFPAVKDLTKILYPSFPFSYPELKRSCLKVYQEERAKVMQTMENLDGLIALSMDILRRDTCDYHSYELPEGRTVFDDVYKKGTEKTILKCLSDLHIESKISTITPGDRINW